MLWEKLFIRLQMDQKKINFSMESEGRKEGRKKERKKERKNNMNTNISLI